MKQIKIAVLISGRGSNLKALYEAQERLDFPAHIKLVISDNDQALGYHWAEEKGLNAHAINAQGHPNRNSFEAELIHCLSKTKVDLIVLAGFMKVLSADFLAACPVPIINIHPSLLPKHPGLNTHQRAIEAGDKQHGCSVHYVTEKVDAGQLLGQSVLEIQQNESAEHLANRVLALEHKLLVNTVEQWAHQKLKQSHLKFAPDNGLQEDQTLTSYQLEHTKTRRVFNLIVTVFLTACAFIVFAFIALPWVINTDKLALRIQNDLLIYNNIKLEHLESSIELYPSPALVLKQVKLTSNQTKEITVKAKTLSFALQSLLIKSHVNPNFDTATIEINQPTASPNNNRLHWLNQWLGILFKGNNTPQNIEKLSFKNSTLRYTNATHKTYEYLYGINGVIDFEAEGLTSRLSAVWRGESFEKTITINKDKTQVNPDQPRFYADFNLTTDFGEFDYKGAFMLTPFFLGQGNFAVEVNDISRFERWREHLNFTKLSPLQLDNIAANGEINFRDDVIKTSNVTLSLNDLMGDGNITFGNDNYLQATLHFKRLTSDLLLAPLLVNPELKNQLGDNLLSAQAWRKMNLDLRISANEIMFDGLSITPLAFTLISKEGKTNITIGKAGIAGGSFSARTTIQALKQGIETEFIINAENIDIERLTNALNETPVFSSRVNLKSHVIASGTTSENWRKSAKGNINITTEELVFLNYDLERWQQEQVNNQIVLSRPPQGQTIFEPSNVNLSLNDGIISFNKVPMTTPSISVSSTGIIDLRGNKELNITTQIKNLTSKEKRNPLTLRFSGSLKQPTTSLMIKP